MSEKAENSSNVKPEIFNYYSERFSEAARLEEDFNVVELLRTRDILERHLPAPPAVVLDVGGAAGVYTVWLLEKGYEVHLIDPVPKHVEQAKEAISRLPGTHRSSATVGHGGDLKRADGCVDAVLLMGPLYHLTEKRDRIRCLREAHRVLRRGGMVFAVGISRFASLIDGLHSGCLEDPEFAKIVERDLDEGQHRNPTGNPYYWTDAYLHLPDELEAEVREAGFVKTKPLAIEGLGWAAKDHKKFTTDPKLSKVYLDFLRKVEEKKSLLGASPHIAVLAHKP
ncbi:MAG TPA: class I SAM-dependent methyltransferase [Acidobacteriota bacterium]|nr:class I SAM-dependent methyltransferase [Acidobacteriota bacterium]